MKKYAQIQTLSEIFDLSIDYFRNRMKTEFQEGVHYFRPPTNSKTKKAVLWDVGEIEKWIRQDYNDSELVSLLERSC